MIVLALTFARTLELIYDEWSLLGRTASKDEFVFEMGRMCSYPEIGFLHPELVDTPRAFGNFWTI